MNENSVCPIWGTEATVHPSKEDGSDDSFVDSPRAGGKYCISGNLSLGLENRDERFKARLTSWLSEQRQLGVKCPGITEATIESIEGRRNLSVPARADMLLRYLSQLEPHVGGGFGPLLGEDYPRFLNMLAWSESTVSTSYMDSQRKEIQFFLNYLEKQGWISPPYFNGTAEVNHLTVKGYARLDKLENVTTNSSQAFVAMWFDDWMKDTYEIGIKLGIEAAGYEAKRIDRVEHINKIDDEIIAEIKRSRFVVADFTHGDSGARGGVYYEAGFAHGLNIPVIFTCREDILEDIHFDTRQFNHIAWESEKPEELCKALANRIAHVIGDGPNKSQGA